MSITDEIEEKLGLKIDSLNTVEKETYFSMLTAVQKSAMSPEKMRDYIISMRIAVEQEIVKEPAFKRIFIFKVENLKLVKLQARLQNYLLLESFLVSPERAKRQLEEMVEGLAKKI